MVRSDYFLTGDVQIDIEWWVHEQDRYESVASPDVDNIIKPVLDALCGSDGVLIDDCQVQAVSCYWVASFIQDQEVRIRIKFDPDEWLSKQGLVFVHMGRELCMPVPRNQPAKVILTMLECWERMFAARDKLLDKTGDYYTAKGVMSVQRVFHRRRLGGFDILELDALKSEAMSRLPRPGT